jgi:hypothetical protein
MSHVPYPDELPDCSDTFFATLIAIFVTFAFGAVIGWVMAITIYC